MLNLKDLLSAQQKLKAVAAANTGGTPHGTLAQLAASVGAPSGGAATPPPTTAAAAIAPAVKAVVSAIAVAIPKLNAISQSSAQRRSAAMKNVYLGSNNKGSFSEFGKLTQTFDKFGKEQQKASEQNKIRRKEEAEDLKSRISENKKRRTEEAELVAGLVSGFKTFKSPLEKFKDSLMMFNNPKKGILKALNVGGIFDKTIARGEFIDKQMKLGSNKSKKDLKKDFENANKFAKQIQANESAIDAFRKTTGLSEGKMAGTKEGRSLLGSRVDLTGEYAKHDLAAQNESGGESPEERDEGVKREEEQIGLMEKIVANTTPIKGVSEKALPKPTESSSGGGLLGGLGTGMVALGKGIRSLLGGAGKGIQLFLTGLAKGLSALANPKTLIGLGAVVLALMGIGKALEYATPAIKAFAPVLMKVAEVVGTVFIKAIETIPAVIKGIGDVVIGVINAVVDSIQKLANIDGSNLMSVGAGLLAVAGGMVAFGASQAVSGVGNLVGGLLGAVTPGGSAIDQVIALGKSGPNIEKAGVGVEKLASGLTAFSKIDTDKIKAIAALPTEKIAAMGAAMGRANIVAGNSAANAGAAQSGGGSSVVVAPTTNVNNTKNEATVYRHSTRNTESTFNRHIDSRYSPA